MVDIIPKKTPVIETEAQRATGRKLSELSERTRLLEERLKQTREKIQVIDETFMNKTKDLKGSISSISEELSIIRRDFEETKEILRRVVKEIGSLAKVGDVKVLEKYINMVDVTRIVTKSDVERIVDEKLKSRKKG